jgi:rubredoxin
MDAENAVVYHPDPEINAEVAADALEAERADLAAGYPPRRWKCPSCGAEHERGHFMTIGIHRCLGCGYAGPDGVMLDG